MALLLFLNLPCLRFLLFKRNILEGCFFHLLLELIYVWLTSHLIFGGLFGWVAAYLRLLCILHIVCEEPFDVFQFISKLLFEGAIAIYWRLGGLSNLVLFDGLPILVFVVLSEVLRVNLDLCFANPWHGWSDIWFEFVRKFANIHIIYLL